MALLLTKQTYLAKTVKLSLCTVNLYTCMPYHILGESDVGLRANRSRGQIDARPVMAERAFSKRYDNR